MAEQPPKKIGSLRDRIAAFEHKGPAPAPAPAPAPRPKPAGLAWKPRATSPPPAAEEHADKKGAGMSAADAKESIRGGGGSLKERMAALQGLSSFGGAAPAAPPPRPAGDKPKWKPPPIVSPPADEPDTQGNDEAQPAGGQQPTSPPVDFTQTTEGEEAAQPAADDEEGETKEPDPEDEERQRRAAIAARMARLGGARVGMGGPPVFGRKPDVPPKKISTPKVEEPKENVAEAPAHHEEVSPAQTTPAAEHTSEGHSQDSQDYIGDTAAASSTSLLSADSGTSSASRSPSMPVPAAPRRAAPPRRKAPKSPSPASAPTPHVLDAEAVSESPASTPLVEGDAKSQELQEDVRKSKEDDVALGLAPPASAPESAPAPEDPDQEAEEKSKHELEEKHEYVPDAEDAAYASALTDALEEQAADEEQIAEGEALQVHHDEPAILKSHPHAVTHEDEAAPVAELVEEEEDEATRRQRVLERMRQQGAFNPFSAPPPVKVAAASPEADIDPEGASPVTQTETPAPPPVPTATRPERRDSTASARSAGSEGSMKHAAVEGNDPNVNLSRHRMSVMSIERENMHTVTEEVSEEPTAEKLEVKSQVMADASHEEDRPLETEQQEEPELPRRRSSSSYRRTSRESQRSATIPPTSVPMRRDSFKSPPPMTSPLPTPSSPSSKRASLPPPPRALPTIPQGVAEQRPPSVHRTPVSSPLHSARQIPNEPDEDEGPPVPVRRPSTDSRSSRRSIPPARPRVDYDDGYDAPVPASAMPPVPPPHRPSLDVHPERRSFPPPSPPTRPEAEYEETYDTPMSASVMPPVPPPHRLSVDMHSRRKSIPPPPPPPVASGAQYEDEYAHEEYEAGSPTAAEPMSYTESEDTADVEEEAAPPPPPRRASVRVSQVSKGERAPMSPVSLSSPRGKRPTLPPAPPPVPREASPIETGDNDVSEQEVLDEEDGDPIDPTFYGAQRSAVPMASVATPASAAAPVVQAQHAPPTTQETAEDSEHARRRAIAERMAKLGGISFGAPLPPATRPPPPPPAESPVETEGSVGSAEDQPAAVEEAAPEEEEDEAARKQRIAARLASMGGMRFGMLPAPAAPPPPPPPASKQRSLSPDIMDTPRAPPVPVTRPPPPPVDDPELDSDYQSVSDGVPYEGTESEMEEIGYEDAEEAPPPPVPTREGRRVTSPVPATSPHRPSMPPSVSRPPVPTGRPPVPGTPLSARPPLSSVQSDYVIVEPEVEEEEAPPPPPPRTSSQRRAAPSLAPPPPPGPSVPRASGISQWENTVNFGDETDLSLSAQWSEDSTQYPPSSQIPPPPPPHEQGRTSSSSGRPVPQASTAPLQLAPDELMQQWGRVGVQIHEMATTLFEKSRKSPIGDGTYLGFVTAVVKQIPNAMQPSSYDTFGYLFYEQNGPSVQKRASEIMPGDIIVLQDAKLKGHKGLQIYHQNVGIGQPVCAIVGDFEVKKAKVKVYQANQHVGQESVESVSYRLEDLKSGTVKVFRVLEAQ